MMKHNRWVGAVQAVQTRGKVEMRKPIWEAQMSGNTLELFLYDAIEGGYYDYWEGENVEPESSEGWFRRQIESAGDVAQINLYVNSPGGDVWEAQAIRAHLLRSPAKKTAYIDGIAASAASMIITACDEIRMLTGSTQMIHNASTFGWGNANQLREIADELDSVMASVRMMYLERAGDKLAEDKLIEMLNADTFLTPAECVELGLADEVISSKEYKNLVKPSALRQEPAPQAALDPEPPASEIHEPPEDPATDEQPNMAANFMAALIKAAERTQ